MKHEPSLPILGLVLACLCATNLTAADGQPHRSSSYLRVHVKTAFREPVAKAAPSTVRVLLDNRAVALGTIVDRDGHALTKASLLGAGRLECQLHDSSKVPARLVGRDDKHDLALLKLTANGLTPVRWRTGDPPVVGSWLATVDHAEIPIAIGVVGAEVRSIAASKRHQQRGVLGTGLETEDSAPRIATIDRNSAGQKAGLKVGDVVKSIDGVPMVSVHQMVKTVRSHPPGRKITLVVKRDDKELTLAAVLQRPRSNRHRHAPEDHWGGGPFSQRRDGFPSVLLHDMVVPPSKCGGPIIDVDGNVVGINIARALRVTSYAVPADAAQDVAARLKASSR